MGILIKKVVSINQRPPTKNKCGYATQSWTIEKGSNSSRGEPFCVSAKLEKKNTQLRSIVEPFRFNS